MTQTALKKVEKVSFLNRILRMTQLSIANLRATGINLERGQKTFFKAQWLAYAQLFHGGGLFR